MDAQQIEARLRELDLHIASVTLAATGPIVRHVVAHLVTY